MNEEVQDVIVLSMKRCGETDIKDVARTTVSSLEKKARFMAINGPLTPLYDIIWTATEATIKNREFDKKLVDRIDELTISRHFAGDIARSPIKTTVFTTPITLLIKTEAEVVVNKEV